MCIFMFEKLFGGKKEGKTESEGLKRPRAKEGLPTKESGPSSLSSERSPPSAVTAPITGAVGDKAHEVPARAPIVMKPRVAMAPALRVASDASEAEERARAALQAISAAVQAEAAPATAYRLPESSGVREEAAALFSVKEHKRAIDLLVGHLNQTSGNSPKAIWFMLMDAYQAMNQQAAFEKSAALFANFFKTSPPSWDDDEREGAPSSSSMGRNVLVLDGLPSRVREEKLKDYVAAARLDGHAKLDLSRSRLDEDHSQRVDDLRTLLLLMRRLRRYKVQMLLMGENQLVEVLRTVIQRDLPVPSAELYWELLLEFLQWRGQEEAYEDLAVSYAIRFGRSAPGFELDGIVARAPDDQPREVDQDAGDLTPPESLEDPEMETWCNRLESALALGREVLPLHLGFSRVRQVSFSAAGILAARLRKWEKPAAAFVLSEPTELILALFEITGVAGQVIVEPRHR